jgi:hypothetical protein
MWYSGSWSSCPVCGGGTSTRTVYCMKSDGTIVADSLCTGTKPIASQSCNTPACTVYHWEYGTWGSCSVSCGTGTQSRSATCKDSNDNIVADSYCSGISKGTTIQYCNTQTCITYSWVTGGWSSCTKTCGGGTQSRSVICMRSDGITSVDSYCTGTKPATVQSCNTQNCPANCRWVLTGQPLFNCWVNTAPAYPIQEYGPDCTTANVGWSGYFIYQSRDGTTHIWTSIICTSAQMGQTVYRFTCTCI